MKVIWRTKKGSLMYQSLQLVGDPPPLLVFEISEQGVAGVRRNPKTLAVEARAFCPLPQGAVEASAVKENVHNPEELRQAVEAVLQQLGPVRRPDVALILPDDSSRLTVLDLDKLPADARERLALIRWRLKKTVPFDIDRARISYLPQPSASGVSVLVAATPPEVVQQYEAPFQLAGLFPGYVSLSTAAALNLTRGGGMNVLAKMAGRTLTIVALQNGAVRMIRHVDLAEHSARRGRGAIAGHGQRPVPDLCFHQGQSGNAGLEAAAVRLRKSAAAGPRFLPAGIGLRSRAVALPRRRRQRKRSRFVGLHASELRRRASRQGISTT